ncbi:MAG: hypothetical protein AAF488_14505 [Planctomycetota bacterium]
MDSHSRSTRMLEDTITRRLRAARFWTIAALACLAPNAAGEEKVDPPAVEVHTLQVFPDQFIDLDTRTVLSRARVGTLVADLQWRDKLEALVPRESVQLKDGRLRIRTDSGRVVLVSVESAGADVSGGLRVYWIERAAQGSDLTPRPEDAEVRWDSHANKFQLTGVAECRIVIRAGKASKIVHSETDEALLEPLHASSAHVFEIQRVTKTARSLIVRRTAVPYLSVARAYLSLTTGWSEEGVALDLTEPKLDPTDGEFVFRQGGIECRGRDSGVRFIGNGRRALRNLLRIPDYGWGRFVHDLKPGDVLALRTSDHRYARVVVEAPEEQEARDELGLDVTFLASGGRELPGTPFRLEWEPTPEGPRISWKMDGLETPKSYVLTIGEAVYRSATQSIVIPDLDTARPYKMRVYAIYSDHAESDEHQASLHVHPIRSRAGSISLRLDGPGHDFASGRPRALTPDIRVRSAESGPRVEFPHGGALVQTMRPLAMTNPVRKADSVSVRTGQFLWIRTRGGGAACVKVRRSGRGRYSVEYRYRMPNWWGSLSTDQDRVRWVPWPGVTKYRVTVEGMDPRIVTGTSDPLSNYPRNARSAVVIEPLGSDASSIPAIRERVMRYSSAFQVRRIPLPGLSREFGLTFESSDAASLLVRSRHGIEARPLDSHGNFPSVLDEGGSLPEVAHVDVREGGFTKSLLIRLENRDLVSVLALGDGFQLIRRKYVSVEDAIQRTIDAGSKLTQTPGEPVADILADLDAPEPGRRRIAMRALRRLELAAAPQLGRHLSEASPAAHREIRRALCAMFERDVR